MTTESIGAGPERHRSELPLLTAAERQQLLVDWNATQTDYPTDRCIHELFAEQAARTPEAIAVVCGDAQLTYRELNDRATHLAHHLQRRGVGPESLVGLCVDRSPDMVVGLLGILTAGGAYVPLDPAYPAERLAFMLADAQVAVLLTQERLRERLPHWAAPLVCLDSEWEVSAQQPVEDVCGGVSPENLAYVLCPGGRQEMVPCAWASEYRLPSKRIGRRMAWKSGGNGQEDRLLRGHLRD
jgi:non-ribosomal peptide synthetase component F